jgi:hypothetical protein
MWEQLGQRYMSLDLATLGREAIRGMLNPGGKPASELNPLAIFAGGHPARSISAYTRPNPTCMQLHVYIAQAEAA